MSQYRTIPLKPATYERLQNLGQKGQTWDDIVNRLLKNDTEAESLHGTAHTAWDNANLKGESCRRTGVIKNKNADNDK